MRGKNMRLKSIQSRIVRRMYGLWGITLIPQPPHGLHMLEVTFISWGTRGKNGAPLHATFEILQVPTEHIRHFLNSPSVKRDAIKERHVCPSLLLRPVWPLSRQIPPNRTTRTIVECICGIRGRAGLSNGNMLTPTKWMMHILLFSYKCAWIHLLIFWRRCLFSQSKLSLHTRGDHRWSASHGDNKLTIPGVGTSTHSGSRCFGNLCNHLAQHRGDFYL
jgi:hypothetical protein